LFTYVGPELYPEWWTALVESDFDPDFFYTPELFYFDQGTGNTDLSFPFPVVFNINLNDTHAKKFVDLLRYGGYVDALTETLTFYLPMYNAEAGLWSLTVCSWSPGVGGTFTFDYRTKVLDLDRYYSNADTVRAAFEIAFFVVLLFEVVNECFQVYKKLRVSDTTAAVATPAVADEETKKQHDASAPSTSASTAASASLFAKVKHAVDVEHLLDFCVYTLLFVASIMWIQIYVGGLADDARPTTLAEDVYADDMAVCAMMRMKAAEQKRIEETFIAFEAVEEALARCESQSLHLITSHTFPAALFMSLCAVRESMRNKCSRCRNGRDLRRLAGTTCFSASR